jgi:hypothetical protein
VSSGAKDPETTNHNWVLADRGRAWGQRLDDRLVFSKATAIATAKSSSKHSPPRWLDLAGLRGEAGSNVQRTCLVIRRSIAGYRLSNGWVPSNTLSLIRDLPVSLKSFPAFSKSPIALFSSDFENRQKNIDNASIRSFLRLI